MIDVGIVYIAISLIGCHVHASGLDHSEEFKGCIVSQNNII